jgi:L-alanine-DL-glutamate epimerase-like enolase superfamily enzyme
LPLWAYLAREEGRDPGKDINVYASGGHYRPARDIEALCEEVRAGIARGHRRFKIKIGGLPLACDLKRVDAVLKLLESGMQLAVDGNGTFSLETAIDYANAFGGHPLAWIEEPLHPLDYDLHRELAAVCPIPIATGENLFSADDARNLLRHGGLRANRDILQFDVSLSYGIVEYRRILDEMSKRGWSRERCAPHAGHLLAFNVVAGLGLGAGEAAMDESSLFGRVTSGLPLADGRVTLPDAPGTGFETSPIHGEVFSALVN